MLNANTWTRFVWLISQMADALPVYLLLSVLPVVALLKQGRLAGFRAVAAVLLAHIGPIVVLFMGAALYGKARSHSLLGYVQLAVGVIGVAVVVSATKALRPGVPKWAFTLFFAGVAIMNWLALFIGGMALADDWI